MYALTRFLFDRWNGDDRDSDCPLRGHVITPQRRFPITTQLFKMLLSTTDISETETTRERQSVIAAMWRTDAGGESTRQLGSQVLVRRSGPQPPTLIWFVFSKTSRHEKETTAIPSVSISLILPNKMYVHVFTREHACNILCRTWPKVLW